MNTDRMAQLWRRLKDHRIAQWTVGYVALAYGIQHGVVLTREAFEGPQILERVSMLALILGLPLVITFAWYHGERTTRRVSGGELSIISLLLVVISILFFVFARPAEEARTAAAVTQAGATAPAAPALTGANSLSLAVLPFVNLSPDKDQEFFSDGMTEEITSALAKIPRLPVVGRTSAFQFKGQNKDIRAIGQALNATYLLEGSVRTAGDRVRITAQLIRASDDRHVWTDSYDRELKDVFAVQEDVARAIAASLQVPLGLGNGENLIQNRAISPEAYQQYLRARALIQSRGFGNSVGAAIDLLQQIVAREPSYGPAWALLAQAYSIAAINNPPNPSISAQELHRATDVNSARAEEAARKAIEIDPRNAEPYIALARTQYMRGRLLEADQASIKALSLDPLNSELLHAYSHSLALVGRFDDAIAMRHQISEIDPLVPIFNAITARMLWSVGDNEKALAAAEALPSGYGGRGLTLAMVYAGMGRYKEAADAAATTPPEAYPPNVVNAAVRLLRRAPRAPQESFQLGVFSFAFAYAGDPERSLAQHEFLTAGNSGGERHEIWQPALRSLRNTPRFKALVRKMGLIEYWNARGWPDFCHPTTGDDFVCT